MNDCLINTLTSNIYCSAEVWNVQSLKLDKNYGHCVVTYTCFCRYSEVKSLNIQRNGSYYKQKSQRRMKHSFYIQYNILKVLWISRLLNRGKHHVYNL